jgi:hypothetical protein
MKLSDAMGRCLYHIQQEATEGRPWVVIPSWRWSAATAEALKRRGLVELCRRHKDHNPNDMPKLTLKQFMERFWSEPWCKLTEKGIAQLEAP